MDTASGSRFYGENLSQNHRCNCSNDVIDKCVQLQSEKVTTHEVPRVVLVKTYLKSGEAF